jgi:hypothetical protein
MNEDYGIDSYYEDSFADDYNAWEEHQVWLDSVHDDEEGDDYPE